MAAGAFPDTPGRLDRTVRQGDVVGAAKEGPDQRCGRQLAAVRGRVTGRGASPPLGALDHQIAGDGRPDLLALEPHRSRQHAEERRDSTALVRVDHAGTVIVAKRVVEVDRVEMGPQVIEIGRLIVEKNLGEQLADLGDVIAGEGANFTHG